MPDLDALPDGHLRLWAAGFRHAADNRHYHLDPVTAREVADRFDAAAGVIDRLTAACKAALDLIGRAEVNDMNVADPETQEGLGVALMLTAAIAEAETLTPGGRP